MIGRRISQLSSSKEVFLDEAPAYTAALRNSGYSEGLDYTESSNPPAPKRTRKRKVLWFNPPWNDAVATNVAGKFLQLIDKHFPKGSQYHKYFNRNTVKVSYSSCQTWPVLLTHTTRKLQVQQVHPQKRDTTVEVEPTTAPSTEMPGVSM